MERQKLKSPGWTCAEGNVKRHNFTLHFSIRSSFFKTAVFSLNGLDWQDCGGPSRGILCVSICVCVCTDVNERFDFMPATLYIGLYVFLFFFFRKVFLIFGFTQGFTICLVLLTIKMSQTNHLTIPSSSSSSSSPRFPMLSPLSPFRSLPRLCPHQSHLHTISGLSGLAPKHGYRCSRCAQKKWPPVLIPPLDSLKDPLKPPQTLILTSMDSSTDQQKSPLLGGVCVDTHRTQAAVPNTVQEKEQGNEVKEKKEGELRVLSVGRWGSLLLFLPSTQLTWQMQWKHVVDFTVSSSWKILHKTVMVKIWFTVWDDDDDNKSTFLQSTRQWS